MQSFLQKKQLNDGNNGQGTTTSKWVMIVWPICRISPKVWDTVEKWLHWATVVCDYLDTLKTNCQLQQIAKINRLEVDFHELEEKKSYFYKSDLLFSPLLICT